MQTDSHNLFPAVTHCSPHLRRKTQVSQSSGRGDAERIRHVHCQTRNVREHLTQPSGRRASHLVGCVMREGSSEKLGTLVERHANSVRLVSVEVNIGNIFTGFPQPRRASAQHHRNCAPHQALASGDDSALFPRSLVKAATSPNTSGCT